MNSLQQQARALGDPTRYAVYRYLLGASGPVDIAELTTHFELNHNAIRQHLAKLVAAGLVLETLARPAGPGRPRLLYGVDHAAGGRWGATGPYERLSLLLAEMIGTGDSALDVGRRAGRDARVAPGSGNDGVGGIAAGMATQGFAPEVRAGKDAVEVVLHHCPFESTAVADPDTVCSLHLGIAEGLAEESGFVVDDLVVNDPRRANCRLRLRRPATEATVDQTS